METAYSSKVFSPLSHAVSHVAITAMTDNHTLENKQDCRSNQPCMNTLPQTKWWYSCVCDWV